MELFFSLTVAMKWSIAKFVSYFACGYIEVSNTTHFHLLQPMFYKILNEKPCVGKFCCKHFNFLFYPKKRSTSMGHPQEYIVLPGVDMMLDLSCGFTIFLTTFSAQAFRTCHKHNRIWTSTQTFLLWNKNRK